MWTSVRIVGGKSFAPISCAMFTVSLRFQPSDFALTFLLLFHSRISFSCTSPHDNGHGLTW